MESLISTFHLDLKLMIAQVVNFAVVFVVLYVFALKPLKKVMDERNQTIASGLENAKKQEELLKNAEAEYKAIIAKANQEATVKAKEVKKEIQELREAEIAKVEEELTTLFANGKKQAEAEKNRILDDARKELATMVITATEKVLGDVMDKKLEGKVIEDAIKKI